MIENGKTIWFLISGHSHCGERAQSRAPTAVSSCKIEYVLLESIPRVTTNHPVPLHYLFVSKSIASHHSILHSWEETEIVKIQISPDQCPINGRMAMTRQFRLSVCSSLLLADSSGPSAAPHPACLWRDLAKGLWSLCLTFTWHLSLLTPVSAPALLTDAHPESFIASATFLPPLLIHKG